MPIYCKWLFPGNQSSHLWHMEQHERFLEINPILLSSNVAEHCKSNGDFLSDIIYSSVSRLLLRVYTAVLISGSMDNLPAFHNLSIICRINPLPYNCQMSYNVCIVLVYGQSSFQTYDSPHRVLQDYIVSQCSHRTPSNNYMPWTRNRIHSFIPPPLDCCEERGLPKFKIFFNNIRIWVGKRRLGQ